MISRKAKRIVRLRLLKDQRIVLRIQIKKMIAKRLGSPGPRRDFMSVIGALWDCVCR